MDEGYFFRQVYWDSFIWCILECCCMEIVVVRGQVLKVKWQVLIVSIWCQFIRQFEGEVDWLIDVVGQDRDKSDGVGIDCIVSKSGYGG